MKLAPVYLNNNDTLAVIPRLVDMPVERLAEGSPLFDGSWCFVAQVACCLAAVTNIPADVVFKHAYDNMDPRPSYLGILPQIVFDFFQTHPIRYKRKLYKLSLSLAQYKTIKDAIRAVETGQPVMMIVETYGALFTAYQVSSEKTGIVPQEHMKKAFDDTLHHVLLMIGHDRQYKHAIIRDTQNTNAARGFGKISTEILSRRPKLVKHYLTFVVDEVKVITIPKQT